MGKSLMSCFFDSQCSTYQETVTHCDLSYWLLSSAAFKRTVQQTGLSTFLLCYYVYVFWVIIGVTHGLIGLIQFTHVFMSMWLLFTCVILCVRIKMIMMMMMIPLILICSQLVLCSWLFLCLYVLMGFRECSYSAWLSRSPIFLLCFIVYFRECSTNK